MRIIRIDRAADSALSAGAYGAGQGDKYISSQTGPMVHHAHSGTVVS
jgi:hypothetical protein